MRADELLDALGERHAKDVFVAECKNGPTQTGSHRRLDAWVMLKTWSPVTTIGYEIKVSRADWRRDEKVGEYAGLVHLLYVVAPKDVVPRDEVPPGVGLLEPVGTQKRLVTRVKAQRREIEMPVSLLVYVLMCRAEIVRRGYDPTDDGERRSYRYRMLAEWAAEKSERRALNRLLGKKIRDQFDAQEQELRRLTQKLSMLEQVAARIRELGFDPEVPTGSWRVEQRIKELSREIPASLPRQLEQLSRTLGDVGAALRALREPDAAKESAA